MQNKHVTLQLRAVIVGAEVFRSQCLHKQMYGGNNVKVLYSKTHLSKSTKVV